MRSKKTPYQPAVAFFMVFLIIVISACKHQKKEPDRLKEGSTNTASYSFDKKFLTQNDSDIVELRSGESAILVSAKYQAKVFTSTTSMDSGRSLGWINYKAFSASTDPHMNAYGGENRLWLGPEGGKFSLFFRPGQKMEFENWKTPTPIDIEPWRLVKKSERSATMTKDMRLINYAGYSLSMNILRLVTIQQKKEIENTFEVELNDSVEFVGYSTINTIRNTGDTAWNDTTGMPCIWILDMFNPSPATTIVIPFKKAAKEERVATTNYFGEIEKSRLRITDSIIFFKADGRKRGKMGVLPKFALPVAGSYDAVNNILTIVRFDIDSSGKYLNQVWKTDTELFSGDAMNAYNDGPLDDDSQMGPFYELESVSPAAALDPGGSISHTHNVYHFTGRKKSLDSISRKILGTDLMRIEQAFRKSP